MSKNQKRRVAIPAIRNFVAKNQWQRGGVHDTTNKAKRHKAKQQLKRAIRSQSAADFFACVILAAGGLFVTLFN